MNARVMEDNEQPTGSPVVRVVADGGCRLKNPSDVGGMWAFRHIDDEGRVTRQSYGVILVEDVFPLTTVTNNLTETLALLLALEALPDAWNGLVCSDSQNAIRVFQNPNKDREHLTADVLARCRAVCKRLGKLSFKLLCGHPTKDEIRRMEAGETVVGERGYPYCLHNVWCDTACRLAWHEFEGATA